MHFYKINLQFKRTYKNKNNTPSGFFLNCLDKLLYKNRLVAHIPSVSTDTHACLQMHLQNLLTFYKHSSSFV